MITTETLKQPLMGLLTTFGTNDIHDKAILIDPIVEKTLQEYDKAQSHLPLRALQTLLPVIRLEIDDLQVPLINGAFKIAARTYSAKNDNSHLQFLFKSLMDSAEKMKDQNQVDLLHTKALEVARFVPNLGLDMVYERFNKPMFTGKDSYVEFLTEGALRYINEPKSRIPQTVLECYEYKFIKENDCSKEVLATNMCKLVKAMHGTDKKYAHTDKMMEYVLEAATSGKDKDSDVLYNSAFELSHYLKYDIALAKLLKRFDVASAKNKQRYIEPILEISKNALVDKNIDISKTVLPKFSLAMQQNDPDLKLKMMDASYSLVMGIVEAGNEYKPVVRLFETMMRAAGAEEDDNLARVFYNKAKELHTILVQDKALKPEYGDPLAMALVQGLNPDNGVQNEQFDLMNAFLATKQELVINNNAKLQPLIQKVYSGYMECMPTSQEITDPAMAIQAKNYALMVNRLMQIA